MLSSYKHNNQRKPSSFGFICASRDDGRTDGKDKDKVLGVGIDGVRCIVLNRKTDCFLADGRTDNSRTTYKV